MFGGRVGWGASATLVSKVSAAPSPLARVATPRSASAPAADASPAPP